MPNNVENSIKLIEQYTAAARTPLELPLSDEPNAQPYQPSQRLTQFYETIHSQPEESLDEKRARAAVIARNEQREANRNPNPRQRDELYRKRVKMVAMGTAALALVGVAKWGITEAVEGINDFSDRISDIFPSSETTRP